MVVLFYHAVFHCTNKIFAAKGAVENNVHDSFDCVFVSVLFFPAFPLYRPVPFPADEETVRCTILD